MRSLLFWNVKIIFSFLVLWNWLCRDHEMSSMHYVVYVDAHSLATLSFLPHSLSPPPTCCLPVLHVYLSVTWAGTGTLSKFGLGLWFLNIVWIGEGCVTGVLAWCSGQAVHFISLLASTAPCSGIMFVSFVRIGAFSVRWYVKWVMGYWTVHSKMKYILLFHLFVSCNELLSLWPSSAVVCSLACASCFHSSLILLIHVCVCVGWAGVW
jgi:hypothetical protein